jgi:hypothetical protein
MPLQPSGILFLGDKAARRCVFHRRDESSTDKTCGQQPIALTPAGLVST